MHPCSKSNFTSAGCRRPVARDKGCWISIFCLENSRSTPCSINSRTTASCPCSIANVRGLPKLGLVWNPVGGFGLTPWSRNVRTTSTWPFFAARMIGCQPGMIGGAGGMPAWSNLRTQATFPLAEAQWRMSLSGCLRWDSKTWRRWWLSSSLARE